MTAAPAFTPSPAQARMLDYLRDYHKSREYMPTRREIARHLQTSTSVVDYYLRQLSEARLLEYDRKVARGIRLKNGSE